MGAYYRVCKFIRANKDALSKCVEAQEKNKPLPVRLEVPSEIWPDIDEIKSRADQAQARGIPVQLSKFMLCLFRLERNPQERG